MREETAGTEIQRAELLAEGKTKEIFAVAGNASLAIVSYKNTITAFDDPRHTKEFETKALHSNTTTCRVFEMLKERDIPVAYERKLNDTEFLAANCSMIPLEVVARRYAVGSYLKRHPEFRKGEDDVPHRFDDVVAEFFLKTTQGRLKDAQGNVLVDGLDPAQGEEDPFIPDPHEETWKLSHPQKEAGEAGLGKSLTSAAVASPDKMQEMERMVKEVFLVLEDFWSTHDFKFVDFKIEFGITQDGRLVVSDVIDNDSWRLRDQNWQDVSKESFRSGEDLGTIEDKYALVARILETSN